MKELMFVTIFGFGIILMTLAILGFVDPRRNSYGTKTAPILAFGGMGICLQALILVYNIDIPIVSNARSILIFLAAIWGFASIPGMIGDVRIGLAREKEKNKRNKISANHFPDNLL